MTYKLPLAPLSALLGSALILSSCGKQEAVGDVPSSEELARQADAASKAIRDEAAANEGSEETPALVDTADMVSYTNALRGFTVMVPKSWTEDAEAGDDNGKRYSDPGSGAVATLGWVENRDDEAMQAAVAELGEAGESISGDYVNENEYRATGLLSEDEKTAQRLLRAPDGTMVQAIVTYPAAQAETIDPVATQILDSLTLQ